MSAEDYHSDFYDPPDEQDIDLKRYPGKWEDLPRWTFNRGDMMLNKKEMNRFYVGADHIGRAILNGFNDDWTRKTFDAAVEHGKKLLENEGKDIVLIVEIKAVIRRKDRPVEVIKL